MPLDNILSPEEMKFFETGGELQPGMQPEPTPVVEPPAPAQVVAPPVAATPPIVEPPTDPTPDPTIAQQAQISEMLRQQLADANARVATIEANLQQLQQAPKTPEEPAPDPATDPLGAMMHQLATVNKTVAALQEQLQAQQNQQQQLTQFQQFQAQVGTLRDQFVKTHADFPDAYSHIRNVRIADLKSFGMTEDAIQKALFQEEATLAQQAIRQGKNPAEVVYEMARRHGYVAKATPTAAPATPDAKLQSVQAAQAAAKNLPSTPQLEDITLDGLKAASDADLTKLVNDDKMWAKITGADQYPL